MASVKETADAYIAKRNEIKPFENAFMEKFDGFVVEVKKFVRENKWYTSSNRFVALADKGVFFINDISFYDDEKNRVWVEVEDDDYFFTYDEIENPKATLEAEYRVYTAERDLSELRFVEARRAVLLAELEKLDKK